MIHKADASNQAMVKRNNVEAVFAAIQQSDGISRARLSKLLNLSPSTVTVIVDDLKAKGLVVDTGICDEAFGGVGRTAYALDVNPAQHYLIGVEVAPEFIRSMAFDLKINPVAEDTKAYDASQALLIDEIERSIRRLLARLPGKRVYAAGCAFDLPKGYIDYQKNEFEFTEPFGKNIDRLSLGALSGRLRMPVCANESAAILGAAEQRLYHSGSKTFVYMYLADGVCFNIIQDGHLLCGAHSPMSEIGHMSINLFGPRCACGNRGCFEMYVSNRALLAYYGEAVRGSAATALEKDPAWEEIVAAYLQGDAAASQAVERLNEALAVGITSIINFLNPDTVVLGGTAMRYESQFLDRLREKVLGAAILQYRAGFKLVYARAPQTGDILATGAAQGAYEQCIHRILFPEAFGAVIASS